MLAYLFFTTLKHMKRTSGNGLKWEVQPTHWERDTLLHGLSLSLIEKIFCREMVIESALLWLNFYLYLTILSSNSINLYVHIFRQI